MVAAVGYDLRTRVTGLTAFILAFAVGTAAFARMLAWGTWASTMAAI